MSRTPGRQLLAGTCLLAATLAISACGGGEEAETTSVTADAATNTAQSAGNQTQAGGQNQSPNHGGHADSSQGGQGSSASGGADQAEPTVEIKQTDPPPKTPGGDNSLQEFGQDAEGQTYEDIATAALRYLVVLGKRQTAEMCSRLSIGIVTRLNSGSVSSTSDDPSCETGLKALLANAPDTAFNDLAGVRVGAVRVDGDQAFVLLKDRHGQWLSLPMALEEGTWKVGTLVPNRPPIAG